MSPFLRSLSLSISCPCPKPRANCLEEKHPGFVVASIPKCVSHNIIINASARTEVHIQQHIHNSNNNNEKKHPVKIYYARTSQSSCSWSLVLLRAHGRTAECGLAEHVSKAPLTSTVIQGIFRSLACFAQIAHRTRSVCVCVLCVAKSVYKCYIVLTSWYCSIYLHC